MSQPSHPGLTFLTFRAPDEPERLTGWLEAVSRGFHQGRTSEELRHHFGQQLVEDDVVLRGVWQDAGTLGSGSVPVATYASYEKTLHTGRGLQPVLMISEVTVSPTHRRQGLLRTLLSGDLREAAERGLPLAVLTASEGSIYGRFGFGPAVFRHTVEVDTGPRFELRDLDDEGSLELIEPAEAWPAVSSVFTRFHERTRGSVGRPGFYRAILTGTFDFESGEDRLLRTVIHRDAGGRPDGYVAYRPGARIDGRRRIKVSDLVALSPTAHLRLWRLLADIDLSDSVEWDRAAVDDPLPWALVDPYRVRVTRHNDALWVRLLHVPAALEARPWGRDGSVVLGVDDPLGHAEGRFRVRTEGGQAEVTRTRDPADLHLDAAALGALYLGGVGVGPLHAAGRLRGSPESVATWASMADTGPAPHCLTAF